MSIAACAELVRAGDPNRFATAMCAKDLVNRGDLMVLYAFNVEVSRAPWVTQEPMIAEMRLQWWKDAIAEIYSDVETRKHEVVTPLDDLVARHQVSRHLFDDLIEARRFDIYKEPHPDQSAFETYIAHTSGNLVELAGRSLGASDPVPFQKAGLAFGISNLFQASLELYRAGHDPLPVPPSNRSLLIDDQLSDPDFEEGVQQLARVGLDALKEARLIRSSLPKTTHPALLVGWNAENILKIAFEIPAHMAHLCQSEHFETKRGFALFWRNILSRW